jgi:hypothetical protein
LPDVTPGEEPALATHTIDALAVVLVVGAVVGAALWGGAQRRLAAPPTRDRCLGLLERHVELDGRARRPTIRAEAVAAHQRAIAPRLEATRYVAECQLQLSASAVDCALGAPNVDELERCLQ